MGKVRVLVRGPLLMNTPLSNVYMECDVFSALSLATFQIPSIEANEPEFDAFMSKLGFAVQNCKLLKRQLFSDALTDVCMICHVRLPRLDSCRWSDRDDVRGYLEILLQKAFPVANKYSTRLFRFERTLEPVEMSPGHFITCPAYKVSHRKQRPVVRAQCDFS
jgi:hypothetical protein